MSVPEPAWYHQQESNLYLALRRHSFCPLNYGGAAWGPMELYSQASFWLVSVVGHGVDQIDGALLAGLGAHGEAPGQVVEHEQRAQRT